MRVGDSKSQRELLKGFLKEKGYHILEAENGEKAVEQGRKHHIDFVLLDYKMLILVDHFIKILVSELLPLMRYP